MSKNTPEKKPTGTQAILRAISILRVFTDAQPEWRLSDLVEAVDLNRTTTYRLLTALETTGMVTRDTEGELYRLGSEMIAFGGRALRANPLRKVTHPELKRLSSLTGETVTIDILDGCHTLMLDEVKGQYIIGMMPSIGSRWPVNVSSTGKILLAHLQSTQLESHFPQPMPQLTSKTIVDEKILRELLPGIKDQGFAIASDELEVGYSDMAAPIFQHDGAMKAALTIGGSTNRFTSEKMEELMPMLRETAVRISNRLGFRTQPNNLTSGSTNSSKIGNLHNVILFCKLC